MDENTNTVNSSSEEVNNLAVTYIIPVSVIVGVVLAAITICCVCYRRWRWIVKIRKQKEMEEEGIKIESELRRREGTTESEDEERPGARPIATDRNLLSKAGSSRSLQPKSSKLLTLDDDKDTVGNGLRLNSAGTGRERLVDVQEEDKESGS